MTISVVYNRPVAHGGRTSTAPGSAIVGGFGQGKRPGPLCGSQTDTMSGFELNKQGLQELLIASHALPPAFKGESLTKGSRVYTFG